MSANNALKNQHLMWRAGFGPAVEQLDDLSKFSPKQVFKALVKASENKPAYINVADNYLQGLYMGLDEAGKVNRKELSPDEKKKAQQKSRESIKNLNLYWMHEMVNSAAQLREKMAFFWHGHFACRNLNVFYQQDLLDILRRNSLGNFGQMLKEVSRSAAMLNFLNNQQNKRDHPNENFAREVMELFTLGRGNYTEHDVKEAARAFTGWSANAKGEFMFRRMQHDYGDKTVLGKTGAFDGEEVLDILLAQKQTARFLTQKIYRFFVNDQPDADHVNWLAERFYNNKYDIGKLLEDIFTSDWFYEEKNIGVQIKSPVQLLTGIRRAVPMTFENDEVLLVAQRVLGQVLFYPPNVAGWPGGRTWIDSSSLMMRMRIPQMFADNDEFNVKPKDDDDQMMGRKNNPEAANNKMPGMGGKLNKSIRVNIDWTLFVKFFESTEREKLAEGIAKTLLQTKLGIPLDVIRQYSDESGRENFIKTATLQVMSTPEYQLC